MSGAKSSRKVAGCALAWLGKARHGARLAGGRASLLGCVAIRPGCASDMCAIWMRRAICTQVDFRLSVPSGELPGRWPGLISAPAAVSICCVQTGFLIHVGGEVKQKGGWLHPFALEGRARGCEIWWKACPGYSRAARGGAMRHGEALWKIACRSPLAREGRAFGRGQVWCSKLERGERSGRCDCAGPAQGGRARAALAARG